MIILYSHKTRQDMEQMYSQVLIRHQAERMQSSMTSRHKAKPDLTHKHTHTALDPSSLILRFAPQLALRIKMLYNLQAARSCVMKNGAGLTQ